MGARAGRNFDHRTCWRDGRLISPAYQRREFHAVLNTVTWPQAPERTGPRSAAVLVRRMRASTTACGKVSSAAPRPLRCARDPRTRTAALHKVPLSLGRICSSGWHPRLARPTAGLLSFTRRLPRIPCSLRGLEHRRHVHTRDWNPFIWPQAPERIGPRSAAVLVRRMRASRKSCCIRATKKPCRINETRMNHAPQAECHLRSASTPRYSRMCCS
jgi:hypothetical protein